MSVRAAVAARVLESDQALGLTVAPGHAVVVLGYRGEPFLRIDRAGVAVNARSSTAAAVRFVRAARPADAAAPAWRVRDRGHAVVWHDVRPREFAAAGRRRWTVPLVVDGIRVQLAGAIWRVSPPPAWIWGALAAPFAVVSCLLLVRRDPRLRIAAAAFGAVAAAATIANVVGFMVDSNASSSKWVLGFNELFFAAIGLLVLAFGSTAARTVAAGGLGLLGLFVGLGEIDVFIHGVVLSSLPDFAVRVLAAVMIGRAQQQLHLQPSFSIRDASTDNREIRRPNDVNA
jgi:hypothetical protein